MSYVNGKTFLAASCLAVVGLLPLIVVQPAAASDQARCLFVSSYHQGYAWSDGIEQGLRKSLAGQCVIEQIDMDTRRKNSVAEKRLAGLHAWQRIERTKPAVVITADDNAAKYLIVPYLKQISVPVVFTGINWTVEEYGLPVSNVTGMVEIAPILPLLKEGMKLAGGGTTAIFLAADNVSQRKNLQHVLEPANTLGITVDALFSSTFSEWQAHWQQAQQYDFVIIGSFVGVTDWTVERAAKTAQSLTVRPTITNMEWSMPLAHLGYTKIAEEQGRWAGQATVAILDGMSPAQIPLATNRQWDVCVNPSLIELSGLSMDTRLMRQAKFAQ